MKRGIKNILLSLVGFSAAPILTACYGMPYDYYPEPEEIEGVEGFVVDTDMKPINHIKVEVGGGIMRFSDENGHFEINEPISGGWQTLTATDIDGELNGGYYDTEEVVVTSENCRIVSVVMSKQ